MKTDTLKIAGLQDELNKNNDLKLDVEESKLKLSTVIKSMHDKLDKSEKEVIMMIIKEKTQLIKPNHVEFTT